MRETKPIWTSASFLVYAGGLTVLFGGLFALEYLSVSYGHVAQAGWALLVLFILYVVAHAFRAGGRPLAAGIFAFAAVVAWGCSSPCSSTGGAGTACTARSSTGRGRARRSGC